MLSHGCSPRDVEGESCFYRGLLCLVLPSGCERATEFSACDFSEFDEAYLFVDCVAERLHPGQKKKPVLAVWGFTSEGMKVLLGLMVGSKEDTEMITGFLQDLCARGFGDPRWWSRTGLLG